MNVNQLDDHHSTLTGLPIAESLIVIMKEEITLCRRSEKSIWMTTKCIMSPVCKTSQHFGEIVREQLHQAHQAAQAAAQAHHHLMQFSVQITENSKK